MPSVIQHARAVADMIEIWDHIAEDDEDRADDFVALLGRKFLVIAQQPNIGRTREELAKGLRSFPVGRYIIFYRITRKGIEIARVVHASRDIDTLFHKSKKEKK